MNFILLPFSGSVPFLPPVLDPGHKWKKCSTPPGSSLQYIEDLRNPSCWSESEYFYQHGQFHFLEIQWEIHFLTFLNTDRNAPKKKFRIVIWTFSFEICFRNEFLTARSGQTENTQIHGFAYFQFDLFPKSKIDSESRFQMRMSILQF